MRVRHLDNRKHVRLNRRKQNMTFLPINKIGCLSDYTHSWHRKKHDSEANQNASEKKRKPEEVHRIAFQSDFQAQ